MKTNKILSRIANNEMPLTLEQEEIYGMLINNGYDAKESLKIIKDKKYLYIDKMDLSEFGYFILNEFIGGIDKLSKEDILRFFDFKQYGKYMKGNIEYVEGDNFDIMVKL